MHLSRFLGSEQARRRYWARSLLGWPVFSAARPGRAHRALRELERGGRVRALVTQNVDGLHSRAGSHGVIDLHGRNDRVLCTGCGAAMARDRFQGELVHRNPRFAHLEATPAPDGDADLGEVDFNRFEVPACPQCGGVVRPDVVFFGDAVPRARVEAALEALRGADMLLAVGTSLMVYSGYRFCREAEEREIPIFILNRGRTRADPIARGKLEADCGAVLEDIARAL